MYAMPDIKTENILKDWEEKYKPMILSGKRVPLELVAEILGYGGKEPVMRMLRCPDISFGTARKEDNGKFRYEIFPLRFIAWYEGKMS